MSENESDAVVGAKLWLIDPDSMTVVWMNEPAAADAAQIAESSPLPLGTAMPLAETLGVPDAIGEVARTGVARHLRTSLVATARGGLAIATSVYRLPSGMVLVLAEKAWQAPARGSAEDGSRRRRPRPGR